MIADRDKWIDVEQAASYLGVKPVTVRTWIKTKGLPAKKIGRCWKFKIDEIDDWVKSGKSAID